MFWTYFGLYTFTLMIIWGFFLISRFHSYKFKNFSNHIVAVTRFLFVFLLILSVLGYILIFLIGSNLNNNYLKIDTSKDNYGESYY